MGEILKNGANFAENNGMWKGDYASSTAIHTWVNKYKPKPDFCEKCGKVPPRDLANLKQHQYTRKIEDYAYLCRSCHNQLDRETTWVEGNCKCGKPFKKKKGWETSYCSKKCADLFSITREKKQCSYCNNPIEIIKSKVRLKNYCNEKCYNLQRAKVKFVLKSCLNCKTKIKVRKVELDRGWGKYCSRSCSNKARSKWKKT